MMGAEVDEMTCAIETIKLTHRYTRLEALKDLDLSVAPGECVGLLGSNGAGKSTTMKILLGLLRPTEGRAAVLGHPAGHQSIRGRVGYSPETPHFYPFLTALETLDFFRRLSGLTASAAEMEGTLAAVGLAAVAHVRVGGFSKGMVQRLAVAQALLGNPDLLFLDEPSSGLDPAGRVEMRSLIRRLKARGTTILLSTHIIGDVEEVADRVVMLKAGRLVDVCDLQTRSALGVTARVDGLRPETLEALRAMGLHASVEGETLQLAGLEPGQEPAVVARLVGDGARVFSFTPMRVSLEQRFLRVMGGGADHDDTGC